MDALRATLQAIVDDARAEGVPVMTIGAFAVRASLANLFGSRP